MRTEVWALLWCSLLATILITPDANGQVAEGHVLWQIGKEDDGTSEFALGPGDFAQFASVFKQDPTLAVGISDPKKDWPYAHPGPADAWAGHRSHTFTIAFAITKAAQQGTCKLLVGLVDTHPDLPPGLRIRINGRDFTVALPKGASPDSISGAAAKGRHHRFEVLFPADLLRLNNNTIAITTVSGSWMLYDFLRLEAPLGIEPAEAAGGLMIADVAGTVCFRRPAKDEPIRQDVRVALCNFGAATVARIRVMIEGKEACMEDLGTIEHGTCLRTIRVPDVAHPVELTFELDEQGKAEPAHALRMTWQPQKKWRIYCVSYSHHDLGFGNYPHRLRTDIRHANIERPLKFCAETDAWDDDSKFRYLIETSEPITSFLGTHSAQDAAELARRIREGRIQIGGVHNTANTEELGVEVLARLFYLSGRHTPDLLGVPAGKTVVIDDVVGLTWPLATCCGEAGVPYFFHGHNGTATCLQPAAAEPVFYWQAPDGKNKVLMRSFDYGGYAGDTIGDASEDQIQKVADRVVAAGWPYDATLCQDGSDFLLVTMDNARKIRNWNRTYAYPRLICATMDMFFDDIAGQMDPSKVKTFAKDANNLWADQDANDAWLLGLARRQGETIPAAEKLATIAATLTHGGYPWTDVYQAYHRLLTFHEHTNAAMNGVGSQRAGAEHYETELVENREMIHEAAAFCASAIENALGRLAQAVSTDSDRTLIVFNSLNWPRTDLVRVAQEDLKGPFRLVDVATGRDVAHEEWADGTAVFVATDVGALGYKAFRVLAVPPGHPNPASAASGDPILENPFYRIRFDPQTGAIASIHDKQLDVELVDQSAPEKFNAYLYEYYDSPSFEKAQWHRAGAASLSARQGPVSSTMTVVAKARGVDRLEQGVTLYNDIKRIDFVMDLVKSPSGRTLDDYAKANAKGKEAVYVAFPLAVPDFEVRHETPGAVVEPIRQQFAGSCTAFYAVRHFSDISNGRFGVTLASREAALVEYGRPRSCAYARGEADYESVLNYPSASHLYLYLMNNMFDTNVRIDQRGPMTFTWSMRSHEGDWRRGGAPQFGWEISNPLLPRLKAGNAKRALPADQYSFMSIDKPNVVCTTIKPAEANGSGLILRFNETHGTQTTATVSLPFFGEITAANETSLVEDDRPIALKVDEGSRVTFTIASFGITTIRIRSRTNPPPAAVTSLKAVPVSDMEVDLSWQVDGNEDERISHYNVYRGMTPDFKPALLNLIARPADTFWKDRPQVSYGGWINNRPEPETAYYYRLLAVDRWNNEGAISSAVRAVTLKTIEKNAVPERVEGLRVIPVSDVAPHNYLNLLWRTSCESDVVTYHIHRGMAPGFVPEDSNRIGVVDAGTIVKGSTAYGHTPIDRRLAEFDHQMYPDDTVRPGTTYYYRVCAADRAGQKGPCSSEASGRTRPVSP